MKIEPELLSTDYMNIFKTRNGACVLYDQFQDEYGTSNPSGELAIIANFIIFDEMGGYLGKANTLQAAKDISDKYCQSLNPSFD